MDAIEKIVTNILETGKSEIAAYQATEKQRLMQKTAAENAEITLNEQRVLLQNEQQITRAFHQKQNRQRLDSQQRLLQIRQTFLASLFTETVQVMHAWSAEKTQAFARPFLEKFADSGEVTVILGAFSVGKITQEWLSDLELNVNFLLSEQVLPEEGGFVLAQDGVEYNCLFSTLVKEIQKTESFEIANKLFASEGSL